MICSWFNCYNHFLEELAHAGLITIIKKLFIWLNRFCRKLVPLSQGHRQMKKSKRKRQHHLFTHHSCFSLRKKWEYANL